MADGERIDAIRARLEAAPAGPYRLQSRIFRHDIFDVAGKLIESIAEEAEGRTPALGLAELIATAPADIEFLLAEAERLRRLIVSLLTAGEYAVDDWRRGRDDLQRAAMVARASLHGEPGEASRG